MKNSNDKIFDNRSLANSINSDKTDCNQICYLAIQSVVSDASSLNGVLSVQGSCDPFDSNRDPVNWTTITAHDQTITADGTYLTQLTDIGFRWFRIIWTSSAGTGSITSTFNGKVFF